MLAWMLAMTVASCDNNTWIDTEGTVIDKTKERRSGKPVWFIQVNYFTQPDKEKSDSTPPRDTTKPRTPDEIINSLTVGDVAFGDYETANIKVTSGVYDKYNKGDKIQLQYAKENPNEVRIKP